MTRTRRFNGIYRNFSQPGRKPGRQVGQKLFSQGIWPGTPWFSAANGKVQINYWSITKSNIIYYNAAWQELDVQQHLPALTFWWRRWTEQSRSYRWTTLPWWSPMICTSMCRGLSTNFSRNSAPLPNAASASDRALSNASCTSWYQQVLFYFSIDNAAEQTGVSNK